MMSAIFVVSGAHALLSPDRYASRAKPVTDRLAPLIKQAHPRLPTDPRTLIRLNAAAQLTAGMMLATGRFARPSALILAGSLVPTTAAGHPFWSERDPAQRRVQQIHFLKNLGLIGGLLTMAADTEGRPGIGWRTRHMMASSRRSCRRIARTAKREGRLVRRAAWAGRTLARVNPVQ